MDYLQSIIIAVVEGLTEFLPISSTGHMIIASKALGVPDSEFTKLFTVAIQLGAILAVVVLYYKKFLNFTGFKFYGKLLVAVLPALALGFLFADKIDELLESTFTVALALLLGGVVLLFIDRAFKKPSIAGEEELSFAKAFIIGIWQCLAMIPGVSRSAASIIGGMQQGFTRSAAAEFSFFLAVPTMAAATGYKLLKHFLNKGGFTGQEIKLLAVGNIVAFLVALLAIKFFIGFLKKYGFKIWGYYRIILGVVLLWLLYAGYLQK